MKGQEDKSFLSIRKFKDTREDPGFRLPTPAVYVHRFPEGIRRKFRRGSNVTDLEDFSCTCPEWNEKAGIYEHRDIRRACSHILNIVESREIKGLDKLTAFLLEDIRKHGAGNYFSSGESAGIIIFRTDPGSKWVSFFLLDEIWKNYSWNTETSRWSYGIAPAKDFEERIEGILRQFV
ncbi:MAG: hypothetical protein K9I71_12275 [Ignavibacteriales bacterium]|nr:hypothetical protein [Ignavibacteriales bacterium]MCF8316898.1 hypothetical protein [Ignavibacteriales bacterium]MCF8438459.1 hypothetical protein [Ignavibacteriales bacterium]